ncbi:Protein of unknown function DUF3536 [Desulfovibrio sp. X2]|uniref:DUF3536 domain-containing protein n=1 Tax=Desulfovibrio sp. X2 TaxID=941449 RepID=UPI0003588F99|nr:DUF3536 domain-containing protein [Desulfovibrio sp. X2]EPR39840.1 Protein of unknown function DUF3536 [Desulfovibrio sp. X2]
MSLPRYICLHGHFYQPPRENPWLEEVEVQDSAWPYHDWNERITAQCYGPNAQARILDGEGRIEDIVNNYSRMSFNFGPTLLSWLERRHPEAHDAVIQADRLSRERFSGHGSALAQVYNHMIMPLATERDRRTQLAWGLCDFRRRFGRDPEGIWLPETAVDILTLELLTEAGIAFTILAPRQAARVRRLDGEEWREVQDGGVDPTTPYLQRLPSGRSIALFFYDGPISQDLAFGGLLTSGEAFRDRLLSAFAPEGENGTANGSDNGRDWPQLVHVATDGETYGHHHAHGEMGLAFALRLIEQDEGLTLTNYGEYLERHPPTMEVEIFENSSWSCVHGVERWRADCGCNSGGHPGWTQAWRAPLRNAVNRLGERLDAILQREGGPLLKDPFAARTAYIEVILDRSEENVRRFLAEHGRRSPARDKRLRTLKLLEMARFGQLTYTSCGWFFDEVSGIETVQVMMYAVRAMQLARELTGEDLEPGFLELLAEAPSNVLENGAAAFTAYAKPACVDLPRVAAHYAIAALFQYAGTDKAFGAFSFHEERAERLVRDPAALLCGAGRLRSLVTGEELPLLFAVLHEGGHELTCGVSPSTLSSRFGPMRREIAAPFEKDDLEATRGRLEKRFADSIFTVRDLFRDGQRRVVRAMLRPARAEAAEAFRDIHERHCGMLDFLHWLDIPAPRHMVEVAHFVVGTELKRLFRAREIDGEELGRLLDENQRLALGLDENRLGMWAARWLDARAEEFAAAPADMGLLNRLRDGAVLLARLPLGLHRWRAQNIWFNLSASLRPEMEERTGQGDGTAEAWIAAFDELGAELGMRTRQP